MLEDSVGKKGVTEHEFKNWEPSEEEIFAYLDGMGAKEPQKITAMLQATDEIAVAHSIQRTQRFRSVDPLLIREILDLVALHQQRQRR